MRKCWLGMGDLDQADAFAVVVEAVGLGIEREGKIAAQAGDEVVERLRRVDPEKLDSARHGLRII